MQNQSSREIRPAIGWPVVAKDTLDCPLCSSGPACDFRRWQQRRYLRCARCALVWLSPTQRPSREDELNEYLQHSNDPDDAGYKKHLARLTRRVVAASIDGRRNGVTKGLDFGSGPGPAIAPMLAELGLDVSNYDPFFAPDTGPLQNSYDFITCTEAVEHFHNPALEFATLARLIKPGGLLGLMTRLHMSDIDFANWFYIRPLSHVTFYAPETMRWIAANHRWKVEVIPPDITIFDA